MTPCYLYSLVPLSGQHKWSESEEEQKNGHGQLDGMAMQSRKIKNVSFRASITEDDISDIALGPVGGYNNGGVVEKAPLEETSDLISPREVQEGSPVTEV